MAGFMAGFGSAFSRSFEQASDQRAQREQDAFRLGYADYISQRDKREERKREDSKRLKAAETIAATYSTPENAMIVYDMLLSMDESTVIKTLQDNEIVIDKAAPGAGDQSGLADPRDGLAPQAEGAVSAQMTQSGMAPPADKGIFGNMLGSRQDKMARETNDRIAQTAGVTPEEVQETKNWSGSEVVPNQSDLSFQIKPKVGNKRMDPTEITDVDDAIIYADQAYEFGTEQDQLRAERILAQMKDESMRKSRQTRMETGNFYEATRGVGTNPDGSKELVNVEYDKDGNVLYTNSRGEPFTGTVKEFNKNTEEYLNKVSGDYSKPVSEYNEKLTALKSTIKTADDIAQLQQQFPDAATAGGDIAQFLDKTARGAYGTLNIVTDNWLRNGADPAQAKSLAAQAARAEAALEKSLGGVTDNVNRNAIAAALIDIKATKLAYAMAAQSGQTGRAVSVQEFQAWKDAALGRGNPESAQINTSDFIASELEMLKSQFETMNGLTPENDNFKNRFGVDLPIQFAVDPEADIRSDKKRSAILDRILEKGKANVLTQTRQGTGNASVEDMDVMKKYNIQPDVWEAMEEQDRALFRQ